MLRFYGNPSVMLLQDKRINGFGYVFRVYTQYWKIVLKWDERGAPNEIEREQGRGDDVY